MRKLIFDLIFYFSLPVEGFSPLLPQGLWVSQSRITSHSSSSACIQAVRTPAKGWKQLFSSLFSQPRVQQWTSSNSMLHAQHFIAVTPDSRLLLPACRLRPVGLQLQPCPLLCVPVPFFIKDVYHVVWGEGGCLTICLEISLFMYGCYVFRV